LVRYCTRYTRPTSDAHFKAARFEMVKTFIEVTCGRIGGCATLPDNKIES
jgi:hypothetical protein